jgi:hypothetical protein
MLETKKERFCFLTFEPRIVNADSFLPFLCQFSKIHTRPKERGWGIFFAQIGSSVVEDEDHSSKCRFTSFGTKFGTSAGASNFLRIFVRKKVLGRFSGTTPMCINCRWICTHLVCIVTKLPLCGIRTYSSSAKGHHGIGLRMPRTRIWVWKVGWLLAMRYHVCRIEEHFF